jgi:hypothetical protein
MGSTTAVTSSEPSWTVESDTAGGCTDIDAPGALLNDAQGSMTKEPSSVTTLMRTGTSTALFSSGAARLAAIDVPGAASAALYTIDHRGVFAGGHTEADNVYHGSTGSCR